MGKVRGLRARVHQAAVRLRGPAPGPERPAHASAPPQASAGAAGGKDWAFHTDIFAKTQIDPRALVQKLELDQESVVSLKRVDSPRLLELKALKLPSNPAVEDFASSAPAAPQAACKGLEAKAILPKKEKRRLRREQWLQKMEAIKLAEKKLREERKRRATVVVGDLHPLMDALPELQELEACRQPQARSRATSQPRPAELSRMSAAQRQKLLEEEQIRFQELLASPAYRASPLLAIGQQLARQMHLEGGSQF